MKKPEESEETVRRVRDQAAHTMLEIWPEVRAMAHTNEEITAFERLTEAFQALLLADKIVEGPEE